MTDKMIESSLSTVFNILLQIKKTFHSVISKFSSSVLILCVGCIVCSCSTVTQIPSLTPEEIEQEAQIQANLNEERMIAATQRVADASWPLITSNLDLCEGFTDFQIGLWTARKIRKNSVPSARIWGVAKDSPAAIAGLQPQDMIISVDGNSTKNGTMVRSELNRALRQFSKKERTEPIELLVVRWETELSWSSFTFSIQPVETCRSEIFVSRSLAFLAYASGDRIGVATGLLNFLENEADLQYIIAHELAHNVYRHVRKAIIRGILGGLLDGISLATGFWTDGLFAQLGITAYSKRFENEADYVSMYILANAGVDLNGIEDVWRRVSEQIGIRETRTHPSRPIRYLRMAKTRQEITEKIEMGEPLIPELKRDR
ncbi:MAG: M48 family metalloprotease [Gammaproteobacteria bacterium]|nr:M48 family metalloprotease [Gammaproteobacteria bacterium]MYF01464.1 M48 family metalloprotease [Gammaproteobacteria bacterium]MYI76284.1 M48 family metalloprotease [Gammaproteobacteria bacterium]